MMLVVVCADRSDIHGLGLFARRTIRAGTPVWRFCEGFDQTFDPETFAALPALARAHLEHFGYFDAGPGLWVLNGDLAIFMNHSEEPNTGAPGHPGAARQTVALRDIGEGEELTCDYRAFDAADKPLKRS